MRRLLPVAVALLALAPVTSARAAFPGQNGKIAFTGINTVYPDGRDYMTLCCGDETEPNWSADGTKVVFERYVSDEDPTSGAYINSDGSGFFGLGPSMQDPAWSPDGAKVVFRSTVSGARGLSLINADGTGRTVIVPEQVGTRDSDPVWSSDGQTIAFMRCISSACEVLTMNPDGTAVTSLGSGFFPNWSPDSSRIVFSDGVSGFWAMNRDGTSRVQLRTGGSVPVWSPDGQKIAFVVASGCSAATCGIYTMNIDGTNERRIRGLPSGLIDWQPCASPCPSAPLPPYDTPASAESTYVRLVPNFRQTISSTQCQARGGAPSTHGPPLSLSSCNPPGYVPGTVAHIGNQPGFGLGYVQFFAAPGSAGPGDGSDIYINGDLSDVRNSSNGDYLQSLTLVTKLRVSDTYNGSGSTEPGTVQDFDLSIGFGCAPYPSVGSRCSLGTSADAAVPGVAQEGEDVVIQVFRVRINDSGADGVRGNADDRTFATQGIYIP